MWSNWKVLYVKLLETAWCGMGAEMGWGGGRESEWNEGGEGGEDSVHEDTGTPHTPRMHTHPHYTSPLTNELVHLV